jgi:hypothetical protein
MKNFFKNKEPFQNLKTNTTANTHLIFLLDKLKNIIEKINVKLK